MIQRSPVRRGFRARLVAVCAGCIALLVGSVASAGLLDVELELGVEFRFALLPAGTSATALQTVQAVSPPLDEIRLSTVPISLNALLLNPFQWNEGPVEVRLETIRVRPDLQGGNFGDLSAAVGNAQSSIAPATLPIEGGVRLCFLSTGCTTVTVGYPLGSETQGGGYVGAGVGGQLTVVPTPSVPPPGAPFTIIGAPWTLHTASVSFRALSGAIDTATRKGFAHGPVSMTGTTTLTSGVLGLVSATQVRTSAFGQNERFGTFHRLSVRFVPEPSLGMLFLAGALACAGLAARSR